MATLVLSAVGTAIGGPLGGALGALVGNQLDQAIAGSPKREGPRLKELAVTTSSYGTAIARHYGQVRTPGSIIWATDLVETREQSGGGKGKPSVSNYSYAASFAVALASRPIKRLGRIWADGNLLRGNGSDLKVGGELRIYLGHGDQPRDPIIASDRGAACPAFRNTAYCVFESLQLAEFGNRIPGLTFEVIADDGEISLEAITQGIGRPVIATRPLPDLTGFSDEGGSVAASLATIDQVYPISYDASDTTLRAMAAESVAGSVTMLPEAAAALDEGDSFGPQSGQTSKRQARTDNVPIGLRYYDTARDFQAGLQRVDGRAQPNSNRLIEFPGALPAAKAKELANAAYQRSLWATETLSWRVAEIDPSLSPGRIVAVPGRAGYWRVESWEWRDSGVELQLCKIPPDSAPRTVADPGDILAPPDKIATPTLLHAFEVPWSGSGAIDTPEIYAAASSLSSGWTGAALYAEIGGSLSYLKPSGRRRSIFGSLANDAAPADAALFDRRTQLRVELVSPDFQMSGSTMQGLADGENRLLLGDEVLQFASANPITPGIWELSGLLRGRGGTEAAALRGHEAGTAVVLLDDKPVPLDTRDAAMPEMSRIAAIGLADTDPVLSPIANAGISRKPLIPVHPRAVFDVEGYLNLSWTRRARGAWYWPVADVPLNESVERYVVGLGDPDAPVTGWETSEPKLRIDSAALQGLAAQHAGASVWVRQVGSFALSDPLLLHTLD